jgi:hypothetical protein
MSTTTTLNRIEKEHSMTIEQYRETMDTEMTLHDYFGRGVPEWISPDLDVEDLVAIHQGGLKSHVTGPATLALTAASTMAKYGSEVMRYLESEYQTLPVPGTVKSWSHLCAYYLQLAIERYVAEALHDLGVEA